MESQGHQVDPALNAKMLTASKDVHSVGKETVGGVSTTHYTGTFTLQDALAKLGTDSAPRHRRSIGQTGFDKMTFDIWIDGQQLPRKMTLATPPGAKLEHQDVHDLHRLQRPGLDHGPAKSQVADGSDLMGGGGASPSRLTRVRSSRAPESRFGVRATGAYSFVCRRPPVVTRMGGRRSRTAGGQRR